MTDELGKKELEFEDAKAQRLIAKHRLEAARGRLHMTLVARRPDRSRFCSGLPTLSV